MDRKTLVRYYTKQGLSADQASAQAATDIAEHDQARLLLRTTRADGLPRRNPQTKKWERVP